MCFSYAILWTGDPIHVVLLLFIINPLSLVLNQKLKARLNIFILWYMILYWFWFGLVCFGTWFFQKPNVQITHKNFDLMTRFLASMLKHFPLQTLLSSTRSLYLRYTQKFFGLALCADLIDQCWLYSKVDILVYYLFWGGIYFSLFEGLPFRCMNYIQWKVCQGLVFTFLHFSLSLRYS